MTIFYSASAKGFYNTEVGYSSYPNDIVDVTDQYEYLFDQITYHNKRIIVVSGSVELVNIPIPPITWDTIRAERDKLLAASDYTQLLDAPVPNQSQWAAYRQQLRDITQSFSSPDVVVWPNAPEE